jgi:Cu/Ag efflux pump CusA
MASLGITAADVAQAIREQNLQVPAGQVGQPPATRGQSFQYSLRVQGRLIEVDEFADVIVGSKPDGSFIRIRDIGRVELGARSYSNVSDARRQAGGRHLDRAGAGCERARDRALVKAELARLAHRVPEGPRLPDRLRLVGLRRGLGRGGREHLLRGAVLVLIVVFLFLQNWRTTLIPMLAVPVSLIATFAAFQLLGFTINTLSLFGMVLAIGIVVDDAIVVVEAVEHNMAQGTRRPRRDDQGDGRGAGPGRRDRTDPRRRVRADGIHPGRHRAALQAVRRHGRRLDDVLGAGGPDADAGAVHDADEAAQDSHGPLARFFKAFNSGFDRLNAATARRRQRSRAAPSW